MFTAKSHLSPQNASTMQERNRILPCASNRIKSKKGSKNARLHYKAVTLKSGTNNNPVNKWTSLALKQFHPHDFKDIQTLPSQKAKIIT